MSRRSDRAAHVNIAAGHHRGIFVNQNIHTVRSLLLLYRCILMLGLGKHIVYCQIFVGIISQEVFFSWFPNLLPTGSATHYTEFLNKKVIQNLIIHARISIVSLLV